VIYPISRVIIGRHAHNAIGALTTRCYSEKTSAPRTFRKTPLVAVANTAPVVGISLLFPASMHDMGTGEQTTGDLLESSVKITGSSGILCRAGCMLVRVSHRSRACGEYVHVPHHSVYPTDRILVPSDKKGDSIAALSGAIRNHAVLWTKPISRLMGHCHGDHPLRRIS
jgi:hypothetical protein